MSEKTMQEHRCTACGEQLQFDPEQQALVCRGCKTKVAREQEAEVGAALQTGSLTCPNCGAELPALVGVARQANCGFCDSTFAVVQDGEDCPLIGEIPENHQYIIPFSTSREAYEKGLIAWLAKEKGTPVDAFEEIAMIRSAEGYYIPHYICVASYQVNWTASIGYDRVETYVEYVTKTVNGNTVTEPVTRTRIVTDWRPGSGTAAGRVTNECPATHFLQNAYAKIKDANTKDSLAGIKDSSNGCFNPVAVSISPTSAKPIAGVPYDNKYTAGFKVLSCELPATIAYNKAFINSQISSAIERSAPGDHIRNLHFNGDIIPSYSLVYLPVWTSLYSYQNKICASNADGTQCEVQYGTRPIDKDQKRRARKAFIPFIATLALAIVLTIMYSTIVSDAIANFYEAALPFIGLLVLGTLIAAFVIRWQIFRKSRKALEEQVDDYLKNPSKIFGRKSSKPDPISSLVK